MMIRCQPQVALSPTIDPLVALAPRGRARKEPPSALTLNPFQTCTSRSHALQRYEKFRRTLDVSCSWIPLITVLQLLLIDASDARRVSLLLIDILVVKYEIGSPPELSPCQGPHRSGPRR
jgi:hypothetical protein